MPRMRGIDQAFDFLIGSDPECALTRTALRRLVVSGQIPSVRVGKKYLIDLDQLEHYLANPPVPVTELYPEGKIRRIAV